MKRRHQLDRTEITNKMLRKLRWRDDWNRIRSIPIKSGNVAYSPAFQRTMRAKNEFFTATAVWRKKDNVWSCVSADHPIEWMTTTPFEQVKLNLLKMGCSWEWLPHKPALNDEREEASPSAARSPKPLPLDCGTPCNKLEAHEPRESGAIKTRSSEPLKETASSVASLSLQTGAQPNAGTGVPYREQVVPTAGG